MAEESQCFVAGTQIRTTAGNKSIEDIKVGDKVLSKDDKTSKFAYKKVKRLFKREVDKTYTVQVGKEKIETTAEHPFWVKGKGWVKTKDLLEGDLLEDENGAGLAVEKITIKEEKTTVYNFEVEDFHTYYVSDTGVWVHNTCDAERVYEDASYHGKKDNAIKSRSPKSDQAVLDNSIEYSERGRIGISENEIVVLMRYHVEEKDGKIIEYYHGHVR